MGRTAENPWCCGAAFRGRYLCLCHSLYAYLYIHKDNEWYNLFGYSQQYGTGSGNLGSMYGGHYYSVSQTPFILVFAGPACIITIIVLVLGMSIRYQTILLDSSWWPLTESGINVAFFILYVCSHSLWSELCYYPLFNTAVTASFCQVEGGQMAAMIFLLVTMIAYLISAIVCLKLWRQQGNTESIWSIGG